MQVGDERGEDYLYPVGRINPKGDQQKCNIIENVQILIGTLFIETMEKLKKYGYNFKTLCNKSKLRFFK